MENNNDEKDKKAEKALSDKIKKIGALTSLEIENDSKVVKEFIDETGILGDEIHIRKEDGGHNEPICGKTVNLGRTLITKPYTEWLKLNKEAQCDDCETRWNETHK